MQSESGNEPIQIETTAEFDRRIRALAKKYRHIKSDLQPLILTLTAGETPGAQITGLTITVFKVRLKNTDAAKGKSGGYRVIYYLALATRIILLTIYSKSEQEDIAAREIEKIVETLNSQ